MVAARLEREIAEANFLGQKLPAEAPPALPALEALCDKDTSLKIGGGF